MRDLNSLLPLQEIKKVKDKRELQVAASYDSLLRGIYNLWEAGRMHAWQKASALHAKHIKQLSPKHDPRTDALFALAERIYTSYQDGAVNAGKMLLYLKSEWKRVSPTRSFPNKWRQQLLREQQEARSMSYTKALSKANDHLRLLPPEEFDLKQIELENNFKQRRSRKVRRK